MKTLPLWLLAWTLAACTPQTIPTPLTIEEARNGLIERIVNQLPADSLALIDHPYVMQQLTPEEERAFATQHWQFTIDRPSVVSVMRFKNQPHVPFWLPQQGFIKTDKEVKNENYTYEVWQKEFEAGEVALGINGFDLQRVVYFVAVKAVADGEAVRLTNVRPNTYPTIPFTLGAFTYNDWDELVITHYPADLEGATLLTTVRGRARDAAVVGAFRATEYPASETPDQIVLTWSQDPCTTQSVQWRTNLSCTESLLTAWPKGEEHEAKEWKPAAGLLKDVYIYNNMEVKHWEVTLSRLKPDTEYQYRITNLTHNTESNIYTFRTAPATPTPFNFIYLGDVHNNENLRLCGEMAVAEAVTPAFITVAGDNVSMGEFRNLWDYYFEMGKNFFPRIPLMPTLGNHDSQDGIPPTLYTQLFALPTDSSSTLPAERNYTFAYSNARFFMLDATGNDTDIATWLEAKLKESTEEWKIVVVHFPPYFEENGYPSVRQKLCSLYDTYGVDLVLTGHIHQYFRSFPIYHNQRTKEPGRGTVYVTSVTVDARTPEPPSSTYNQVYIAQGGHYQVVSINGRTLRFVSKNRDGETADSFQLTK